MRFAGFSIKTREHPIIHGNKIEQANEEERGWNVRGAFVVTPENCISSSEVAGATKLDRLHGVATKTAHDINHFAIGHGARDNVDGLTGSRPNFFSVGEIVADDFFRGI